MQTVTLVLDGKSQTMDANVSCTEHPDGALVIYAAPPDAKGKKLVRVVLSRDYRLTVHTVGIRLDNVTGFTSESNALYATRFDDTYVIGGRMPPDAERTEWLQFSIEVTCAEYLPAENLTQPGDWRR